MVVAVVVDMESTTRNLRGDATKHASALACDIAHTS
jgi:hypothetical protein